MTGAGYDTRHDDSGYPLLRKKLESIGSSTRIEGGKLSNHEVERLLASLNQTSFASQKKRDLTEARRHGDGRE